MRGLSGYEKQNKHTFPKPPSIKIGGFILKFLVVCDIIILSAYRNMLVTQDDKFVANNGIIGVDLLDKIPFLEDSYENKSDYSRRTSGQWNCPTIEQVD